MYRKMSAESQEERVRLALEVVAAESKQALKEFIEFPYSLYRGDPYWVPPLRIAVKELLDRKKHPFYANADAEFFLARRDGQVVGRIAAILDRNHNKFHEENAGFFGFFESIDDAEVPRGRCSKPPEVGVRPGREVPARAGEPLHELRMRHAGRRLRLQPDGHDDLQPALLSGADGEGGAHARPRISTLT